MAVSCLAAFASSLTYLQLAEIGPKLLKGFFKRYETRRKFRCNSSFRKHHLFLVQEGLEP